MHQTLPLAIIRGEAKSQEEVFEEFEAYSFSDDPEFRVSGVPQSVQRVESVGEGLTAGRVVHGTDE